MKPSILLDWLIIWLVNILVQAATENSNVRQGSGHNGHDGGWGYPIQWNWECVSSKDVCTVYQYVQSLWKYLS